MESTLNITLSELQARIGLFLGWGRGAIYGDPAWSSAQQFDLDGITQSALRQFYFACQENGAPIDWSFLRPLKTFTLASGTNTILMPDEYGGHEGEVSLLTSGTTALPWRVEWTNEGKIRQQYSVYPTMTGPPQYVCEQPLLGGGTQRSQRFQLFVFPKADQAYTLQLPVYINPDYLTLATPYIYGGAQHAETILEACLSVAEKRLDDQATVHAEEFKRRLLASIALDRRNKPDKLGRNLDRSDWQDERWNPHYYPASPATYNGQPFG